MTSEKLHLPNISIHLIFIKPVNKYFFVRCRRTYVQISLNKDCKWYRMECVHWGYYCSAQIQDKDIIQNMKLKNLPD